MRLYLLHPRSNAGEYLDGASKVLTMLTKEFGPYPYAEFAIAEVPPEQAHKAGFSGAGMNGFMLAETASLDAPFNLGFYGHEIGHRRARRALRVHLAKQIARRDLPRHHDERSGLLFGRSIQYVFGKRRNGPVRLSSGRRSD